MTRRRSGSAVVIPFGFHFDYKSGKSFTIGRHHDCRDWWWIARVAIDGGRHRCHFVEDPSFIMDWPPGGTESHRIQWPITSQGLPSRIGNWMAKTIGPAPVIYCVCFIQRRRDVSRLITSCQTHSMSDFYSFIIRIN